MSERRFAECWPITLLSNRPSSSKQCEVRNMDELDDVLQLEAALRFIDEFVATPSSEDARESSSDDDFLSQWGQSTISDMRMPLDPVDMGMSSEDRSPNEDMPDSDDHQSSTSTPLKSRRRASRAKSRAASYSSNRARDERRLNLMQLRKEAALLEQDLKRLKRERRANENNATPSEEAEFWSQAARNERVKRKQAEQENVRLKAILENQVQVTQRIERIVYKPSTLWGMEEFLQTPETVTRLTRRVYRDPGPVISACMSIKRIFTNNWCTKTISGRLDAAFLSFLNPFLIVVSLACCHQPMDASDESAAFEATLRFLDEYADSEDGEGDAVVMVDLDSQSVGDPERPEVTTASTQVGGPAHELTQRLGAPPKGPVKRVSHQNSNKARDERRQELLCLRKTVVQLEEALSKLQEQRSEDPQTRTLEGPSVELTPWQLPGVWKDIAARQRLQREHAEQENLRLKLILENQVKVTKSLVKILNKRSTVWGMDTCGITKRKRVYPTSIRQSDPKILEGLLEGVEKCYREIDSICERLGISNLEQSYCDARMRESEQGLYMEICENKVLPFTVHTAGAAVWQHFAENMAHIPYRQYYERNSKNAEVTEDTIIENIGMELFWNNTSADFRALQVLRRYTDEDRVVILWNSAVDPVEFSDQPLSGMFYRDQGFVLLRTPKVLDLSAYCILSTCHIITPEFACNAAESPDGIAGKLTEFVMVETAATVAAMHQLIENMLVQETLSKQQRAVV